MSKHTVQKLLLVGMMLSCIVLMAQVTSHPMPSASFTWQNPSTSDSGKWQVYFSRPVLINKVYCNTDGLGTVTVNLEIRPEDQPNNTGTTVLASPLTCTGTGTSTATISNANIPGSPTFGYVVTPIITGTSGSPGFVRVAVLTQ